MTDTRETLLDFYRNHSDKVELDDFNILLGQLGQAEIETIQTVDVTVTFRVDVSDLGVLSKDEIEVEAGSVSLVKEGSYTYETAYGDLENVVSVEAVG